MSDPTPAPPASPCVRRCCLDPQNICLGCFRALDEITGWTAADDAQKRLILERARERRRQRESC